MGPNENRIQRLYSAERDSRIDQLPRIAISKRGKRFRMQFRTPLKQMAVPAYRISFISQTEEKRTLSCEFFFYISGKALVIKSMQWKLLERDSHLYGKTPVDADACELIVRTLNDFAVRHKASTIYASTEDMPPIVLLRLGFTSTDTSSFMQLEVQKSFQKH